VSIRLTGFAAVIAGAFLASAAPGAAQTRVYPPPYPFPDGYFAAPESNLRIVVKPKNAIVYVDGYYAGVVDDFDGSWQRLHVVPGQHELTVYLEGYRSFRQKIYLGPNATQKITAKLEKLAAGEPNEPVPTPPPLPPMADQSNYPPEGARQPGVPFPQPFPQPFPGGGAPPFPNAGGRGAPPAAPSQPEGVGTIAIQAAPLGTEIMIDGEHWAGPSRDDERLIVQLTPGRHVIVVSRTGYRELTTEVDVRPGETTPVNVSLTPER